MNLVGIRFGRLTVVAFASTDKVNVTWKCLCDCGKETVVRTANLRSGGVKSCGCLRVDVGREILSNSKPSLKHGMSDSSEYRSWAGMIARCKNRNNQDWKLYGGAGVGVCERWMKFENFIADMGKMPKGGTLGRFLDLGNYEPGNVSWQTRTEQGAERRKKTLLRRKGVQRGNDGNDSHESRSAA